MILVKNEPDSWQRLADAIILQAVKEYRSRYRLIRHIQNFLKHRALSQAEQDYQKQRLQTYKCAQDEEGDFFLSEWFAALTIIDGYDLLSRMEQEAKK